MSAYIVFRDYNTVALSGKEIRIPRGTICEEISGVICYNTKPICLPDSENSHLHFAINDDNNGLRRGSLTYAIAYADTKNAGFRLTREQADILETSYSHFLRPNIPVILFNHAFFTASIQQLEQCASDLGIEVLS